MTITRYVEIDGKQYKQMKIETKDNKNLRFIDEVMVPKYGWEILSVSMSGDEAYTIELMKHWPKER